MRRKNAAKNDSNFITRLLAFVLFVLALAMIYTGVVMPYSTFLINILLISTGIFILLTFLDLVDKINKFGKYDNDSKRCQKDHSQPDNPYDFNNDGSDEDNNRKYNPDDENASDIYPHINQYPNDGFSDYQNPIKTVKKESEEEKTLTAIKVQKADDSDYTKYED